MLKNWLWKRTKELVFTLLATGLVVLLPCLGHGCKQPSFQALLSLFLFIYICTGLYVFFENQYEERRRTYGDQDL
jgi:hypothetical protein